jgi:hypothetical protein
MKISPESMRAKVKRFLNKKLISSLSLVFTISEIDVLEDVLEDCS